MDAALLIYNRNSRERQINKFMPTLLSSIRVKGKSVPAASTCGYHCCCIKAALAPQMQDTVSSSHTTLKAARFLLLELIRVRNNEYDLL